MEYARKQEESSLRGKLRSIGISEKEIETKIPDSINLDEKVVLKRANSNKHHDLWEKECRSLEKKQEQEKMDLLKSHWTASNLFLYLKSVSITNFNTELTVNAYTLQLITTLCYFISEDARFESELKLSLSKGILFRGKSGLGKTYIPMCLSGNELKPIVLLNILEITDRVKDQGFYESPKQSGILYIDDVGTEESPILRYGTPVNWFKEFIEKYHFNKLPYNKLILSTNLNTEEIEKKYGYRVRSRIREMFNVIDLDGKDFR